MDLRQLEYMIAIAEHGSISKAAESLYITQSGLNQQLIKLEEKLGIQLFYRDKHHLQMTQAGKIYIQNAREIMNIKKNTYTILSDLKNNTTGDITLGLTLEHGIDLFTAVFPQFNERYPGIHFHLQEQFVAQQHQMLTTGKIDFALVMLGEQDKLPHLEYIPVYEEDLIIGISRSHPLAAATGEDGYLPYIDIKRLEQESFALMFPNSTMRNIIDPVFQSAGFQPQILIETAMNHAMVRLTSMNFCCTILPHSRIIESPYQEQIAWFRVNPRISWKLYVAFRKNTQLSEASRYFIRLAQEYGHELQQKMYSM